MSSLMHGYTPTPVPSLTISNIASSQSNYSYQGAGIQLNTGVNLNNIFDSLNETSDNYKKYEIFELKEDVLVLSATWKRLRNEKKFQGSISKLVDHTLFSEIQPEDREQANSIRDYYSKKVMMLKLKGKRLTNFREDLNSFIHSDGTMVKEGMFPLVYRLPEFYEYDRTIDDIKAKLDLLDLTVSHAKYAGKTNIYKCAYIGQTFKKTKRLKSLEYWFKAETNECVKIQLEPSNPLMHMWDSIISSKKVLQIKGNTKVVKSDDFDYLLLNDWKLMNFV